MTDDTTLRSSCSNSDPAPVNKRNRGTVSDQLAELGRVAQSHPIWQSAGQMDGLEYTSAARRFDWCPSPPSSTVRRGALSEKFTSTENLPQYEEGAAAAYESYEQDCYPDDRSSMAPQEMKISDHLRWPGLLRAGMLTALTLVGCVILAVVAGYSFRNHYESAPSAGLNTEVDNTPNVTGPANAIATRVIQDSVAVQNWDVEPNWSPPKWLTPSPSSTAPPLAPPPGSGTAPSSAILEEPKRVRTLTMQRDANDPNGQLIDVTSSTRTPNAAETRDLPPAPQQLDKATPEPPTTGGFVVQMSSQRSEAQARASFRLMQEKYPNGLSGRQPIIKRSDLGPKGVFYRTLVGPFASAGDARQFCSSLKAAGGDCIVQKN